MAPRFTVVGEALVDLVEHASARGTFAAHAGGSPYNVAITLGRLDQQVSLAARSGHDAFGRLLETKARDSGVRFDQWQTVAAPTSLAVATLDAAGKAHYDFYLDNTAGLGWDEGLVDLDVTGGVLHVGSLASWRPPSSEFIQSLQQRAFDSGDTLVSYDPNVRPVLITDMDETRAAIERSVAASHIVKTSDEDALLLYPGTAVEQVAARWCALGVPLVIVTHGAAGAVAYSGGRELAHTPGEQITLADTVGAGDSFSGGLLAALAGLGVTTPDELGAAVGDDHTVAAAVRAAVLVSAMTCERPGADPPTRAELDARRAT